MSIAKVVGGYVVPDSAVLGYRRFRSLNEAQSAVDALVSQWAIEVKLDGQWIALPEGPFDTREEAQRFADAEVGVKARIVRAK